MGLSTLPKTKIPAPEARNDDTRDIRQIDVDPSIITSIVNGDKLVYLGKNAEHITIECRGEKL